VVLDQNDILLLRESLVVLFLVGAFLGSRHL
jgi:hypothetical protein